MTHRLPNAIFREVIRSAPLIAMDLCILTTAQKILLGYRSNNPARSSWFVPGGRIRKGETLAAAFSRISQQELGTALAFEKSVFLGVYEHFYCNNVFDESFGTHYVVLTYAFIGETLSMMQLPDDQHTAYRVATLSEFESDQTIHENSRAYAPALQQLLKSFAQKNSGKETR